MRQIDLRTRLRIKLRKGVTVLATCICIGYNCIFVSAVFYFYFFSPHADAGCTLKFPGLFLQTSCLFLMDL